MKKWIFWTATCIASLLNGGSFFGASFNAMRRGLDGVDNQAALLFVPFLWITAALVLILLNIYTLICGIKMEKKQLIVLSDVFHLSGRSKKEKVSRIVFVTITFLLMLLGYSLFASEIAWAAAYALSGGALLVFLYTWKKASVQETDC